MSYIRHFLFLLLAISKILDAQDFQVGEMTLNLIDSTRNRPVKTELWYPTIETDSGNKRMTALPFVLEPTIRDAKLADQRFPVVLLSHGTGGNRYSQAWLAIALARQGYVVAAPDHWGNTFDNAIPEYFVRYWERPMDISFVLNQLIANKTLFDHLDTSRIGAVGFSFGGYTSLALAGVEINCELLKSKAHTEQGKKEFTIPEMGDLRKRIDGLHCDPYHLKDGRIKAFVAFAPALGLGVNASDQTQKVTAPVLIIGAENDRIAPVLTNAKAYHALLPTSAYIELPGKTGHYVFLNAGDASLKKEAKKYYIDDASVNREQIHGEVAKMILEFLRVRLK